MPGSNRHITPGYAYHLTHQCHNRKFLFRKRGGKFVEIRGNSWRKFVDTHFFLQFAIRILTGRPNGYSGDRTIFNARK
jgi:REP element-mobilizing transposase RayT